MFRAFADILDDTPHTYVRRLRIHRIRHNLESEAERAHTITLIANEWGMSDLGRMAGWYRELFGELPSETLARQAALINKATGNLRAIQILLGHTKIENTVRYLGVDIDDALTQAEATEIQA